MYYVANIPVRKDGTIPATFLGYETYESAYGAFHANLQFNYASGETLTSFSGLIISENGDVIKTENYAFPVPVPNEVAPEIEE